jgi:hypothetical protein
MEIETCAINGQRQNNLEYFKNEIDESILCYLPGENRDVDYGLHDYDEEINDEEYENGVEYVMKEPMFTIDDLQIEVKDISRYSEKCKRQSCGFHVHMSSPNIIRNNYGKLFFLVLYREWVTQLNEEGSQIRNFSRLEHEDTARINYMDGDKLKKINKYINKFKATIREYNSSDDIEEKIRLEKDSESIEKFMEEITNDDWINDKNRDDYDKDFESRYFNFNYQNIMDGFDIHIEFRGHEGTTDWETIRDYITFLSEFWKKCQDLTNEIIAKKHVYRLERVE